MAVRKLTESKTYKPGTLLLRFSDQHIDKSQGKDTVFGKLATSLLIKSKLWKSSTCFSFSHM